MIALIPLFPLLGFLINGLWYAAAQAPEGKKANIGISTQFSPIPKPSPEGLGLR